MRFLVSIALAVLFLSAPALAGKPTALKPGQVRVVGKYQTKKLKFGDKRSTFFVVKKGSQLRLRARGPISLGIEIRGLEYAEVAFKLGLDGEMEAEARLDLSPVEVRRLYFHVPEGTHRVTVVAQMTVMIHPIKVSEEALKHEALLAWKEAEAKPVPTVDKPEPPPGGWEEIGVEAEVPEPPATVTAKTGKTPPAEMPTPEFTLPGDKRTSFAVLDLVAKDFESHVARDLTSNLLQEIKGLETTAVISRSEMARRLPQDEGQTVAGCKDNDMCLAELGRALKVDRLVVGHVSKLPESFIVSLRLIDPTEVRVDGKTSESFQGDEEQLARAVRHAGRRLLGVAEDSAGTLAVFANEADAQVYVDNKNRGRLPMPPLLHVPAGRHLVRVAKDGFLDWRKDFYVNAEETTAVWAELKPAGKKWYQHWWVWTIAGVVLAGGGTATYFLVK
jgi:TolB-like protein